MIDVATWPCFVISEDALPHSRLQGFLKRRPDPWPFATPRLYPAVWGSRTGKPPEFTQPAGAWGCWRSHCRLWEDVFSRGQPGAVVFEDDCVFRPGPWASAFAAFMAAAPDDWDQLYLGGQHLKPACGPVNGAVVKPANVNRTHAYIFRATDRSRAAYWRLCDMAPAPAQRQHVDYVFGHLHESGLLTAYCPSAWLCGQAAGVSTITGTPTEERYW